VSNELADELKRHACDELGFDLVGVASARPLEGAAHLREWLARGCHGDMRYMADTAEIRGTPDRFLPGAHSVICVALSYFDAPEPPELAPQGDRVVVARYARRVDYHKVIQRRLVALGRFLQVRAPGARWRIGVDRHPLLERELAQRAGLGWIGKNTCLINRNLGSELLLGELVTDVVLPADVSETNHCGACAACLAACPTRAFDAPWRLDARRCISYVTIEHRGDISQPFRESLGAHLFGCDVCQAVCPWNLRAPRQAVEKLPRRAHLGDLHLASLHQLDAEGWAVLAAGSPLRRLSFARFRRNLAAVAENLPLQAGTRGES